MRKLVSRSVLIALALTLAPTSCRASAPAPKGGETSKAAVKRQKYAPAGPIWAGDPVSIGVPSKLEKAGVWSQPITFGGTYLQNASNSPLELRSVELVGASEGVEVLGRKTQTIGPDGTPPAIGVVDQFPVAGYTAGERVSATAINPYAQSKENVELVLGLRTKDPDGGFKAIDLEYSANGENFVVRLPVEFHYCPGAECPDTE